MKKAGTIYTSAPFRMEKAGTSAGPSLVPGFPHFMHVLILRMLDYAQAANIRSLGKAGMMHHARVGQCFARTVEYISLHHKSKNPCLALCLHYLPETVSQKGMAARRPALAFLPFPSHPTQTNTPCAPSVNERD